MLGNYKHALTLQHPNRTLYSTCSNYLKSQYHVCERLGLIGKQTNRKPVTLTKIRTLIEFRTEETTVPEY